MSRLRLAALALLAFGASAVAASAAELRVACYDDGNECEAAQTLSEGFTKANPDIKIDIEKMSYSQILQSLPVQLAAGNGPDIARVTDFGSISQYLLDIRQYLPDASYWDQSFGPTLDWMRPTAGGNAIYGLMTQLTVTGPFVNKTLFEQANVPLPGPKATWDDWAAAIQKVAQATKTPFGMAWDRSGHRFGGPAISYGAKYFAADGTPAVVDDGFKAMASRFVKWNQDGVVDKDVWAAQGSGYRDAFAEFANGQIVLYLSGSWQLAKMDKEIGTNFDWAVMPNPCGPAACSGMPGGAAFVALKETKYPAEVAKYLDYMASAPVYAQWMEMTDNIPANVAMQKSGLTYSNLSPAANAALKTFVAQASELSPVAYHLQGFRYNRVIFDATTDRLSQAIVGQLSLDQAYQRITDDVSSKIAAAKQR